MTTTAIEKAPHASRLAQVTGFSDQVINLVAQNVAPGCTRLELATYLYTVSRAGFDPLIQPPLVHFIKYSKGSPAEIVVSVNGYRSRAANTGAYAGSDDAVFEYDPADDSPIAAHKYRAPSKATVTVWRLVGGQRVPFTASVRWTEFYPGEGKAGEQYRKRPHNQLAIRAETHALRKAFPNETGTLDVGPVPDEWTQAAALDETAKHDPELVALNARRYDTFFGGEDDWSRPQPKPSAAPEVPTNVDPETGEVFDQESDEELPFDPDLGRAVGTNRRLLEAARQMGMSGLGRFSAQDDWPLNAIVEANVALEQKIAQKNGDAALAARQEANL